MIIARLWKHLVADFGVSRRFSSKTLAAIERAVGEQEKRHHGELRFAVEGGLPFSNLVRGETARERALEAFANLGVWDTEQNSGVLLYVLLGDHAVEIIADRGILAKAGQRVWEEICREMEKAFAAGDFERGAMEGIRRTGEVLARHFPAGASDENRNELDDKPVRL